MKSYPNMVLSPHLATGPRTRALEDMEEIIFNLADAVGRA